MIPPMPLKKSVKNKKKSSKEKVPDGFVFRERPWKEIDLLPKHPPMIPGYKATLPGPPGWKQKQDPGA